MVKKRGKTKAQVAKEVIKATEKCKLLPKKKSDLDIILQHWNSKGIIKHKPTLKGLDVAIKKAVMEYDVDIILQAIDRYATVLNDEATFNTFFVYVWSLPMFLLKPNAMPDYLEDGSKWHSYLRYKDKVARDQEVAVKKADPVKVMPLDKEGDLYNQYLAYMRSLKYDEYLQTEHWQHFRKEALKAAHKHCQLCGASDTILDVHHKTYANRGRETFNDVTILCRDCHVMYHEHRCKPDCSRCDGESGEHDLVS